MKHEPLASPRPGLLVVGCGHYGADVLRSALAGRYALRFAVDAAAAMAEVARAPVELVLAESRAGDAATRALLRALATQMPQTPVIVLADPDATIASNLNTRDGNVFCVLHRACPLSEVAETLALALQAGALTAAGPVREPVLPAREVDALLAEGTVAILALAESPAVLATLATTAGDEYPLNRASEAAEALERLADVAPGILVIEAERCDDVAAFVARAHALQPSVVSIVVAAREAAVTLLGLVGQYGVIRVLPTPLSPGQCRRCLEAAARAHLERLAQPSAATAGALSAAPPRSLARRRWALAACGVALLMAATASWLLPREGVVEPPGASAAFEARPTAVVPSAPTPAEAPAVAEPLAAAESALRLDQLFAPEHASAEALFREVLMRDPANGTARLGLERVWAAALANAEAALDQGDLATGTWWLEEVEARAPGHPRLASLRERLALAGEAGRAAPVPPPPRVREALRGSEPAPSAVETPPAPMPAPTAPPVLEPVPLPVLPVRSIVEFAAPMPVPASAPQSALPQPASLASANEGASADFVPEGELTRLVFRAPDYPRRAYRLGEEGWVELEFTVDAAGVPTAIEVVAAEPPGVFDDNAVAALRRWRYAPLLIDGVVVEPRTVIRLRFEIR